MISHDFASSRLTFTDATVCWGGPFCALAEASLGNLVGFYEEGVSWLKTGDGKNGLSVNKVVNLLTMWRWLFTAHVWQNLMNDSFILRSCAVLFVAIIPPALASRANISGMFASDGALKPRTKGHGLENPGNMVVSQMIPFDMLGSTSHFLSVLH